MIGPDNGGESSPSMHSNWIPENLVQNVFSACCGSVLNPQVEYTKSGRQTRCGPHPFTDICANRPPNWITNDHFMAKVSIIIQEFYGYRINWPPHRLVVRKWVENGRNMLSVTNCRLGRPCSPNNITLCSNQNELYFWGLRVSSGRSSDWDWILNTIQNNQNIGQSPARNDRQWNFTGTHTIPMHFQLTCFGGYSKVTQRDMQKLQFLNCNEFRVLLSLKLII